jgi:hypothetical protein
MLTYCSHPLFLLRAEDVKEIVLLPGNHIPLASFMLLRSLLGLAPLKNKTLLENKLLLSILFDVVPIQ